VVVETVVGFAAPGADVVRAEEGLTRTDPGHVAPAPAPARARAREASAGSVGPGGTRRGGLVRRGRARPLQVVVTVPLSVMLGLSDDPGLLHGYGLLPAEVVRDLATRATWRCAVVDDRHGTLLGLGRSTFTPAYRPGRLLADHVALRDQTCRFPGCGRPATTSELDHLVPHSRGAATCECNVGALCPRHHRLKHEAGWTVSVSTDPEHPPGSLVWRSPLGRRHVWLAPALVPGRPVEYRPAPAPALAPALVPGRPVEYRPAPAPALAPALVPGRPVEYRPAPAPGPALAPARAPDALAEVAADDPAPPF
jgi:uncharacterized protein DUF222